MSIFSNYLDLYLSFLNLIFLYKDTHDVSLTRPTTLYICLSAGIITQTQTCEIDKKDNFNVHRSLTSMNVPAH